MVASGLPGRVFRLSVLHDRMKMISERPAVNDTILSDAVAATAFRRLVAHLQHRTDVQNNDLMGLAGFCRNSRATGIAEADGPMSKDGERMDTPGSSFPEGTTPLTGAGPRDNTPQSPY